MAISADVGSRNHQSFMESGTGLPARRVHVSGGTLAALSGTPSVNIAGGTLNSLNTVVGTVNIVAILGTVTTLQNGTLDMLEAGTISKVASGTVDTVSSLAAGTLNQLQAGTLDMMKAGTVSMLVAGTVDTVKMLQAGTLDMVKAGTVSMLSAGTISTVNGTVNVNLATLISGEDQTNNVMNIEQKMLYSVCTVDAVVKGSAGRFSGFYVNSTNEGTISIYDNASAATGVAVLGTVVPIKGSHVFPVAVTMASGIYFDLVGGTINAAVFYQ